MRKLLIALLITCTFYSCQNEKAVNTNIFTSPGKDNNTGQTKVLTLGIFHFNFPNLDVVKTDNNNQIDVLDAQHQKEIQLIVDKLAEFKPTKIVIERQPKKQQVYDSLYNAYLNGNHKLNRSEEQQIGFRLAKKLGLNKLFCTDAWGTDYEKVLKVIDGNDTIAKDKFWSYFYKNPDSTLYSYRSYQNEKPLFKTDGILADLKRRNAKERIKKELGDYLIGIFKYETEDYEQLGPDYVTSWWFNRNLRIFRNIQRINATAEDRILVIYGAGHMNLLNVFFESSPEYELLDVNDYLD